MPPQSKKSDDLFNAIPNIKKEGFDNSASPSQNNGGDLFDKIPEIHSTPDATSNTQLPEEKVKALNNGTDVYNKTLGIFPIQPTKENENTYKAVPSTLDVVKGNIPQNVPTPVDVDGARIVLGNEVNASKDYVLKDAQKLFSTIPQEAMPVLKSMGFNPDNFMEQLANPNGGVDALKIYVKTKKPMIENNYQKERQQVDSEFPQVPSTNVNSDNLVRENEGVYKQKIAELDDKYRRQQQELNNAVFGIASQKVVNDFVQQYQGDVKNIDPYAVGAEIQKISGDDAVLQREKKLWGERTVDPQAQVDRGILGYQAMQYAAKAAFASGDNILAKDLEDKSANYATKIIDENPEFRKQQVVEAISNEIYKNKNGLQTAITGYAPTEQEVIETGKRLGIREQDMADIAPEDIKRSSDIISRVGTSIIRTGVAPAVEALSRHIFAPIERAVSPETAPTEGQLNQTFNPSWYDNSTIGRLFGGAPVSKGQLVGDATRIETNPKNPNYLMALSDDKSGRWNVNAGSISNAVADGLGQIIAFSAGGQAVGKGIEAAGLVKSAEAANRLGQAGFMFTTGYDRNYAQTPTDIPEANRVALALIYTGAEVAAEQILPDFKITDRILNSTDAGRTLISMVQKDGLQALDKETVTKYATDAAKQWAADAGKEGLEESATVYGQAIGDMFFAPKKFDTENYNRDAWEQGVMGAVSAILPTGAGAVVSARNNGPMAKGMLYEVGQNPAVYIDDIHQQLSNGQLNQNEANEKIQVINTLGNIVKNSVPDISVINGNELTTSEKSDYTNNKLQEAILTEKMKTVDDEVQSAAMEQQVQELRRQRAELLATAGAKDISSQSKTNNNGQSNETERNDEAQGQRRQEGQNVLEQQETETSSTPEQNPGVATSPSPVITKEQVVSVQDTPGFFEEEETTIQQPQNIQGNATTISEGEGQVSPTESSISQRPGTGIGQQENGQGSGSERQATQPQANSSNSPERSTGQFEVQRPEKIDYTTKSGNQKVLYDAAKGIVVINSKDNTEVPATTRRMAIQEAAQNYDFTKGEVAPAIEDATGKTDMDIDMHIAENTHSPIELIDIYQKQEPEITPLSSKETAITDFGGFTTTNESYNRFGDRNNMTRAKGINYMKAGSASLDQVAQEISNHSGLDITEQDLVDYIDRFPRGVSEATRTYPNAVSEKAADKFRELTGFDLTPGIIKTAMEQEVKSLSAAEQDLLNKEYETRQQLESELDDLYAKGEIELQPEVVDNTSMAQEEAPANGESQRVNTVESAPIESKSIEQIAQAAHEVNRIWSEQHGDNSQVPWEEAPAWQKEVAIKNVKLVLENPSMTGQELNKIWYDQKVADGWVYGDVKDSDKKTHPDLVPFEKLSRPEQMKDILFIQTVNSLKSQTKQEIPQNPQVSEIDQQLTNVISEINDLNQKVPKAEAALKELAKKGRVNTDEYKIKLRAWQQLVKKQKMAEQQHKLLSAKVMANEIRKRKTKPSDIDINYQLSEKTLGLDEKANVKDEYYQALEELLKEVRSGYAEVNKVESKISKQESTKVKSIKELAKQILTGLTEEDAIKAKAKLSDIQKKYREQKQELRAGLPVERGANWITEKLSRAARNGDISQEGADLGIDLVRANPGIFDDLAISLTQKNGSTGIQGYYTAASNFVKIFKGADDVTAVHELLHHTERFLTEEIRSKITEEWHTQLYRKIQQIQAELSKTEDPSLRDKLTAKLLYLGLAEDRQIEPNNQNREDITRVMDKYLGKIGMNDFYQYYNPSEWWAVNASRILSENKNKPKANGWIERVKEWYDKLMKSVKNVFGLNAYKNIEKGLNAVLNGETLEEMIGTQMSGSNKLFSLKSNVGISADIHNAALEKAAKSLEEGDSLQDAIQKAVDFVNDRVPNKWDEPKFRESMGEGMTFPLTSDEIRALKVSPNQLSQKNIESANILINQIKNNEVTVQQAEDFINAQTSISNAIKDKIVKYIRKQATEELFKKAGKETAQKAIDDNGGDYTAAMQSINDAHDVEMLNATNDIERENANQRYLAAKSEIETAQTEQKVKDGEIKPVSIFAETDENKDPLFEIPAQTFWKEKKQQLADRYQRLQEGQKNALKDITEQTDAVSAYRLAKQRGWAKIDEIRKYLGDTEYIKNSFFDKMKKAKIDIRQFGLYLYAKHAQERNAKNAEQRRKAFEGKVYELNQAIATGKSADKRASLEAELSAILNQKNPDYVLMPDGGSGMTDEQAKDILDEVEKDGDTDKYEQFAKDFRENVVDKILDFKYESGLLSEDEYESIKNAYENYVPLKIDLDGELNPDAAKEDTMASSRKSGRDLYKSRGAAEMDYTTRFNPVLQSIQDLEYSMLKGEENLANIRMANLVRENPNPEIWEVQPARYDQVEDKNGNVVNSIEKFAPKDGIPVWESGKKSYIVIKDEGLKNTFKKIKPTQALRLLQGVTNIVRLFATMTNPSFIATNALIDVQDASAFVRGEKNTDVIKNFRSNLLKYGSVVRQIFNGKGEWADIAKDWAKEGGNVTFSSQVGLEEQAAKTLKNFEGYDKKFSPQQIKHILKVGKRVAETLEMATRVVVYKSALDAGLSPEKSALLSRDATIDFEKSGTQGIYLNAFKAFLNAGIQGTLGTVDLLRRSKSAQKLALGIIVAGMGEAFVNDMFSDCDKNPEDCYWEVPEWRKQRGIMIPTGVGSPVSVPIGRRFGWFNYLGQSLYSLGKYMSTNGEKGMSPADFTKNAITSLFDYYNPTGGTQPIEQQVLGNYAPFFQPFFNENSFGQPIYPDEKGVTDSRSFFPSTPKGYVNTAKALSDFTGGDAGHEGLIEVSPETLQHIFESTFTGLGAFVSGIVKTTAKATGKEPVQVRDIPVVNRFVRESNMSVTKDKKSELVDKSNKNILTDKEMEKLNGYLDDLIEGGQIDREQKAKTMRFVYNRQKDHQRKINKEEGEE